jgi:GABA(A) receptor-associated protein
MRKVEADRIKERYPARIPVIVERAPRAADIPHTPKSKYLAPGDMSVGQFIYIIRKSIALPPEKALFLFCGQTLPTTATLMRQLYAENGNEDGFLYMCYSGESTFGWGARRSPYP